MTNRNETLIDTLRGSVRSLAGIPALLEGRDIYDETGHVDCELMTAILEFMVELIDAENKAMRGCPTPATGSTPAAPQRFIKIQENGKTFRADR